MNSSEIINGLESIKASGITQGYEQRQAVDEAIRLFKKVQKMEENSRVHVGLDLIITDEDIDDIMVSALEGGITYWCASVKVDGDYKGEYASEQISRGGSLIIVDNEEEDESGNARTYMLTKEKFIQGVRMYVEKPTACDIVEMIDHELHLDPCNADAEVADAIIQYALFAEVIYG